MANGLHWEWRAFGDISDRFRQSFQRLPTEYPTPDETTDQYIWIPRIEINVKLRSGQQQGLKLKRSIRKDSDLELWLEDPNEFFPYQTLDATVLQKVASILGITLPRITTAPTREAIIDLFLRASPATLIVEVLKRRQARRAGRDVQVELAELLDVSINGASASAHHPSYSIGVESAVDLTDLPPAQVDAARDAVEATIDALRLREDGMRTMNYLDIVAEWASAT
jgi:hypothetical protein